MTARSDIIKTRLYPEILPEAISVTASASGTQIATYSAFSPLSVLLKNIWTTPVSGVTLRVDNDSGYATLESVMAARPTSLPVEQNIMCHDSLDLYAVGTASVTYVAYTMRVTIMTILEKLIYGVDLTDDEKTLAEQFEVTKRFDAGILKIIDSHSFKRIVEVAKLVTVAAGGNTRVGRLINVKAGEKAVLLTLAANSAFSVAANDTYLTINRDIRDSSYVKLDIKCMPTLNYDIPVYIPAINRHEVLIESVTGVTNLPVRYTYGIADISILEKIKWFGDQAKLTKKESEIAQSLDLYNAAVAGVI